eukprot:15459876-Alexandrium_andersonii.AAC.1
MDEARAAGAAHLTEGGCKQLTPTASSEGNPMLQDALNSHPHMPRAQDQEGRIPAHARATMVATLA